MKRTLALLSLLFAIFVSAVEVPLKGDFSALKEDGLPVGWVRNVWSGYLPACNLEVIPFGGRQGNSFRISNVLSPKGAAINTGFFPGICGDNVRFTFRARGKGAVKLFFFFKTLSGEWNFKSVQSATFHLKKDWKDFTIPLRVLNGKAGETGSYDVCFEVEQGGEMEISDVKAEQTPGEYRGSEPFPKEWTLFGPVDKEYEPTAAELAEVPAEFCGMHGRRFRSDNRTLDFARLFGAGEGKCGWAFAVIDSEIECDYTIGAGADWWMRYYVNGEVVIDTMKTGNVAASYDISNHVRTVRLKKGRNILAVKIVTGKKSSVLKVGGPMELADSTLKLKLSKMEWTESFDGKTLACTGNPRRIQGYPTNGLLTLTGQAVFSTDDALPIEQPFGAFPALTEKALYRALALRIQNFGAETDGQLEMRFRDDKDQEFSLGIRCVPGTEMLALTIMENGTAVNAQEFSQDSLPAEFLLGVGASGRYGVSITSLSNGSVLEFSGDTAFAITGKELTPSLLLTAREGTAEVTVDNYTVGRATEKDGAAAVPYIVNPEAEFDPVKAGWKLTFQDEFDGDSVDETKWYHGYSSVPERCIVHDGVLEMVCDWNEDHIKLTTGGLHSYFHQAFGYFEARCKFRKEPGWWSAFWLYGVTNVNPFYDGFEIDCYEDYFLTSLRPGEPPREQLDFNLHVYCGETLKSWNYNSAKGDWLSDYHRVGVKWTPFEISYYLDGKLIASTANHSSYDSVTFDAFQHACGITPLHPILSGQPKPSAGDPKRGNYPESFFTDYVRIYEFPQDEIPQVEWREKPANTVAAYGDTLRFSADAAPSAKTGSPIKTAYLFDGGYLIDYKTEPPYDFDVILSQEFYATTDYYRPGRQGLVPDFEKNYHCYSIFVQDEAGNVAFTEPYLLSLVLRDTLSKPYQGVAQVIPGRVEIKRFDEGGNGVAYMDTTPGNAFDKPDKKASEREEDVDISNDCLGYVEGGEWLNFTVDIQEAGRYEATMPYGVPYREPRPVRLFLDNQLVGDFILDGQGARDHTVNKKETIFVELPAGRHVLKIEFLAKPNVPYIYFQKAAE